MEAKAIFEMMRDTHPYLRGKYGKDEAETELEALKKIDLYIQGLVRQYRESNGKERDIAVERNSAKIILSLMGYETEGGDAMEDMDELEDALNYLISEDVIRTAIAEQNDGLVDRLYEKAKMEEEQDREMGE